MGWREKREEGRKKERKEGCLTFTENKNRALSGLMSALLSEPADITSISISLLSSEVDPGHSTLFPCF